jgi:hypothetical protein
MFASFYDQMVALRLQFPRRWHDHIVRRGQDHVGLGFRVQGLGCAEDKIMWVLLMYMSCLYVLLICLAYMSCLYAKDKIMWALAFPSPFSFICLAYMTCLSILLVRLAYMSCLDV